RDRRRHLGAKGGVDGAVAHAETEDHPPAGGIRGQLRRFGAGVGVAHVDAGDPGADLDLPGGRAHQLCCGEGIVVHFGSKDRVEPGVLGFACYGRDLGSTPPDPRNEPDAQSLRYPPSPFGLIAATIYRSSASPKWGSTSLGSAVPPCARCYGMRRILPMWRLDSIRRCASAASTSGNCL